MSDFDKQLKDRLPKMSNDFALRNGLPIIPIYDVANNKLYYQTEPYLDIDGKVKVKRLASCDVEVLEVYQIVEEYSMTTNYGEKDGK